jgi:hypothetical protein
MAITFDECLGQTGSSISPTVARTNNAVPGNGLDSICIAIIATATGPITAVPANWTLIFEQQIGVTDDYLYAYWHKHLGGSEPASHVWTQATGRWAAINVGFDGVHLTTPVDVFDSQSNTSSANCTAPGVDPNYTNDMLLFCGAASSTGTWTAPTGYSGTATDADFSKPAASLITAGGAFLLAAVGTPTGDVIGTLSGAAANAGGLIALMDASPTPEDSGDTGTVSVGTATASGLTVSATAAVTTWG